MALAVGVGEVGVEELYPIMYLDALVVKVLDGHQVRNKSAHVAVGVDMDGIKHVIGATETPTPQLLPG